MANIIFNGKQIDVYEYGYVGGMSIDGYIEPISTITISLYNGTEEYNYICNQIVNSNTYIINVVGYEMEYYLRPKDCETILKNSNTKDKLITLAFYTTNNMGKFKKYY